MILEVTRIGRIYGIRHPHTSPEGAGRDQVDPKPGGGRRAKGRRGSEVVKLCPRRREHKANLMYRIDEGLGVISAQATNRLHLNLARENLLDERDDLEWGQGATDQTFPDGCVGVDRREGCRTLGVRLTSSHLS